MFLFTEKNRRINAIGFISLFILSLLILSKCQKETTRPRSYPRVNTMAVTNITEKGATFNAEIYSLGSEAIINHGFAWGVGSQPTVNYYNKILLGPYETTGTYSAEVFTTLKKDVNYTVRPFLQTAEHIVYGIPVTFKSLGSGAPEIYGFKPDSAAWMDTLIVRGKHFSWIKQENIVKLNNVMCDVYSSTDTTICLTVNSILSDLKAVLSVELAGNVAIYTKDTFRLTSPVLKDFYPKKASWGDTLHLKGKGLSWISFNSESYIKLGTLTCKFFNLTDTTLNITVPYETSSITSELGLNVNGIILHGKQSFELLPPYFTFSPKMGKWGDTIKLSGIFNTIAQRNSFYFNNVKGTVLSGTSNTINVQVPASLSDNKLNVIYKVTPFEITSTDTFLLSAPMIDSFSPKKGTWGNTITLTGVFNYVASLNTVFFNNVQATLLSSSSNTLKVQVPPSLSDINSIITYKINSLTVTSADTFRLFQPVIKSFSPVSGPSGAFVSINGKYLKNSYSLSVKFGNTIAEYYRRNDSTLVATVPIGISGPMKISVIQAINAVSSDDFNVTNPIINNFFPLTSTFNNEITIEGENFFSPNGNTSVKFGIIAATIKTVSDNKIVVYVPSSIDSIPRKILVTVLSGTATSDQSFTLTPPEIFTVQPTIFSILDTIIINGSGFCPNASLNKVYIDDYPLTVASSSATIIKISPPISLPRGYINRLTLMVGNYERSYAITSEIKSQWLRIQSSGSVSWNSGNQINQSGISFALNGKGYMMDFNDGKMISFDPSGNQFNLVATFPDFRGQQGLTTIVNQDTSYLIGIQGFFRYQVESNSWIKIGNSPSTFQAGVAFSLNGKIYYGLPFYSGTATYLWEYNSYEKKWTLKKPFPSYSIQYAVASFSINDKGYVLFFDNVFCRYDPVTDSWTKLSPYPGSGYYLLGRVSYVIDNLGYVGLGKENYSDQTSNEFWIYDPVLDKWRQSVYMPGGGRYNSISFVVNNKAYIGFGYKSNTQQRDFYEFDPNYPLE